MAKYRVIDGKVGLPRTMVEGQKRATANWARKGEVIECTPEWAKRFPNKLKLVTEEQGEVVDGRLTTPGRDKSHLRNSNAVVTGIDPDTQGTREDGGEDGQQEPSQSPTPPAATVPAATTPAAQATAKAATQAGSTKPSGTGAKGAGGTASAATGASGARPQGTASKPAAAPVTPPAGPKA